MLKKIFLIIDLIIICTFLFSLVYVNANNDILVAKTNIKLARVQSPDAGGTTGGTEGFSAGSTTGGTEGFSVGDLIGSNSTDNAEIEKIGNDVIQILLTVAAIISVIVLIILGIKYMFGSVEEKAEYKKTLIPYVVGAGLVFASSSIASVVYNLAINIQKWYN